MHSRKQDGGRDNEEIEAKGPTLLSEDSTFLLISCKQNLITWLNLYTRRIVILQNAYVKQSKSEALPP